jgi:hypothetical protein
VKAFQFRLGKALEWRQTQLEMEEVQFKREVAKLAEMDRQRDELRASARRAESRVREWESVTGSDLTALAEFRLHVKEREREMAVQRAQQLQRIAARQASMLEAQRRCRLLERLRERRLEEWRGAEGRELDELASESFLASWNRSLRRAASGRVG